MKEKSILGVGVSGKIIQMSSKILTPGLPSVNLSNLAKFCRLRENQFIKFGKRIETPDGPYFFKDNGQKVLAVLHADIVKLGALDTKPLYLADDTLFFCHALDDRAGAYAILDYLPKIGIKYDVLITVGEEDLKSTARYFNPPRKYNWMFSFDRAGTDVVLYDYEDQDMIGLLHGHGYKVSKGSYSDIVDLEGLGCKGINFGVGYYLNHTKRCYLSVRDFKTNMIKFRSFYRKWSLTPMPHGPAINFYSADDGFGYLRKPGNHGTGALFQDEDIENIIRLEKAGYRFEKPIDKDTLKEAVDIFIAEEAKRINQKSPQLDLFKTSPNQEEKSNEKAKSEIVELPSQPKEENKPNGQQRHINRGSEDRFGIHCEAEVEDILPWETGKDKEGLSGVVTQPRKTALNILDNRAIQIVKVTPLDRKGENPTENGLEVEVMDVCSQCHNDYTPPLGWKSSVCPKCVKEAFPEEARTSKNRYLVNNTHGGKLYIKEQIHIPIGSKIILQKVWNEHGKEIYQNTGDGWKWYFIPGKRKDAGEAIKAAA